MNIKDIQSPVAGHIDTLNHKLKESVSTRVALLNIVTQYILKTKGKQVRPTFVYLMAMLAGEINERTHTAAAMIELLHTATLVHDDVVDESDLRRGFFSINAIWKNKIAVLVGDYLLSRGLLIALKNQCIDILEIVSESVEEMSEGELLQIEKARKLDITEEVYYQIISKKTASLLKSACAAGVASVCSDPDAIHKAKEFGHHIGMAFQIKDDLLDFSDYQTGKPKGIDIKEQKLTLPLIYTLNNVSIIEKQKLKFIVKYQNKNQQKVNYVIQQIVKSGGIEYATQVMNNYLDKAKSILNQFEPSEAKNKLTMLIEYTINRKK